MGGFGELFGGLLFFALDLGRVQVHGQNGLVFFVAFRLDVQNGVLEI